MSLAGQDVRPDRFAVIPRTLVFLRRGTDILLLRVPEGRGAWAGLLNGVGGHIETGEDPLSSARRELLEETGLEADSLVLCGIVLVHTGAQRGIGLHVFLGELIDEGEPNDGPEGRAAWFPIADLNRLSLVEDLPALLPKVLAWVPGQPPFCGATTYDTEGRPRLHFGA